MFSETDDEINGENLDDKIKEARAKLISLEWAKLILQPACKLKGVSPRPFNPDVDEWGHQLEED